jgi:alpha-L-fucosidase
MSDICMSRVSECSPRALAARRWNPQRFNAARWAQLARGAGMRYAVLTSRHHDGYCLI